MPSVVRHRTSLLVLLVSAIVASQGIELFVNRVLRPNADEIAWISDAVLSVGLAVVYVVVGAPARNADCADRSGSAAHHCRDAVDRCRPRAAVAASDAPCFERRASAGMRRWSRQGRSAATTTTSCRCQTGACAWCSRTYPARASRRPSSSPTSGRCCARSRASRGVPRPACRTCHRRCSTIR